MRLIRALRDCKQRSLTVSRKLRSRPPFTRVLLGPRLKVPPGVLFGQFWAPASECRKECFLSAFWRFLGPKNAKKHSKSTLWGTPRQVPKIAQKAPRGALSGPGPKSTPVNGGRDRKQKAPTVSKKARARQSRKIRFSNFPGSGLKKI